MKRELLRQQEVGKFIKRKCQMLLLIILMFNVSICLSQESGSKYSSDQASRFIKLGQSYRQLPNYDLARSYTKLGIKIAILKGNKYWEAVGYENLGYLDIDNSDIENAKLNLRKSLKIFNGILKMGGGSQEVIQLILAKLEMGEYDNSSQFINELKREIEILTNENKKQQARIDLLQKKIDAITITGTPLDSLE